MIDLFKHADLAIRESRAVRAQTRNDLANAHRALARVRAIVRLARIECERSVSLYCEARGQTFASPANGQTNSRGGSPTSFGISS